MVDSTFDDDYLEQELRRRRLGRRHSWLLLLIGAFALLLWAWIATWPPPILAVDASQSRVNVALPVLNEGTLIRQSFLAEHDGLTAVEVLLVRYGEAAPSGEPGGRLELQLLDDFGRQVAVQYLDTASLSHNQPYSLRFLRQPDSAGREYTLVISGQANESLSVWGYDLDTYGGGELALVGGESAALDLRFITTYQLTGATALAALWLIGGSNILLMLLVLAFMLLPGCVLVTLGWKWMGRLDPGVRWGIALTAGISLWALLWLWLTVLGGRWSAWLLWTVFIAGWIVTLFLHLVRRRQLNALPWEWLPAAELKLSAGGRASRYSWHHILLLLLLFAAISVRLLAVRDLAFPPWVDSSRHALITAVMAERGQAIRDYAPLLTIERFPYHFGFHTLPASLFLMTRTPLPRLLLVMGQLLNGLMPLTIYAGGVLLTRRRSVGLIAAFLVAFPFFFPGYYATWGRLTQLTAMLLLPVALAATWRLVRGARGWRRSWWLLAVLVAGLFLIHFRIFLLYVPFAGLVWLLSAGRNGRRLALAAGVAMLLAGPRAIQLIADTQGAAIFQSIDGYNNFPTGYVTVGWERAFLVLGALSLLLVALAGLRSRMWVILPLILAAWVGLVAFLLSGANLGLPQSFVINLNSAYISFFLPLALLLAIASDRAWRWLQRQADLFRAAAYLLAGAALTALLLFGLRQQVAILNPQTLLAEKADAGGLAWIDRNLSSEDKVAVSTWLWLGQIWAVSDGGAWIVPLTGLDSTTPPVDYTYDQDLFQTVNEFNQQAAAIADWSAPASAEWLQQQGVTHIYVGAHGGFFDPSALAKNSAMSPVYARDGVFIFELEPVP